MQIRRHTKKSLQQLERSAMALAGQIDALESEVQAFVDAQPAVWTHYSPGSDWEELTFALAAWSNDVSQVPTFPLIEE